MIMKFLLLISFIGLVHAQPMIHSTIISVDFGSEKDALGSHSEMISQETQDDYAPMLEGPVSFRVSKDHRFQFLDPFKQKLLILDAKGNLQSRLKLPSFENREIELVDFHVLSSSKVLYLDSLAQELILSDYKTNKHEVVASLKIKDRDLYFDRLQVQGSGQIFSLDRVSGSLFKIYPQKKITEIIKPPTEDSGYSVTSLMGPSNSVLGFQSHDSKPELVNFYRLYQKDGKFAAELTFANSPLGGYDAIEVLNAGSKSLDALLVSHGEQQNLWSHYMAVDNKGKVLTNKKLNLKVIPWYMTRSSVYKAPFLYLLSPAKEKGIEIHRINLSRLKPKS